MQQQRITLNEYILDPGEVTLKSSSLRNVKRILRGSAALYDMTEPLPVMASMHLALHGSDFEGYGNNEQR